MTIDLSVDTRSGLLATERVFERLCQDNRHVRLSRMPDGEVIVMPPAGSKTGASNQTLGARLWNWNDQTGLGLAFDSSSGFTFPNGFVHAPDASWIAIERWKAINLDDQEGFAPIVPDFVVELSSPSDRAKDVREIMNLYRDQGVRLGWYLDPKTAKVEIYRPGQDVEILEKPLTLSGEMVLPGFVLDLKGILFD